MPDLLWLGLAFLCGASLGTCLGWIGCGLLLNAARADDVRSALEREDEYARFRAWYHARDQRAED